MNLGDNLGAVADVRIDLADLAALRAGADAFGRDAKAYFLQGAEAAFDLAVKLDREREQAERVRLAEVCSEKLVRFREMCRRPATDSKTFGRGKPRDHWGNVKKGSRHAVRS